MVRVTGIGGVFIKSKDAKTLAAWYEKHLGINFGGQSYTAFKWDDPNKGSAEGQTVFSFFKQESDYFAPSTAPFMINFRVKDIDALMKVLKEEGVTIHGEVANYEGMGKFGWIIDPEGNKVELWEPAD